MSVLFGTALSEEDKKILDWAKEKKKAEEGKNPQDGTILEETKKSRLALKKDFDKSIAAMAKASMDLTQQVAGVMSDVNKLRKESEEQNKFRRNEIKGLRTTIETLQGEVKSHDLSIKTHREELNILNKLKL